MHILFLTAKALLLLTLFLLKASFLTTKMLAQALSFTLTALKNTAIIPLELVGAIVIFTVKIIAIVTLGPIVLFFGLGIWIFNASKFFNRETPVDVRDNIGLDINRELNIVEAPRNNITFLNLNDAEKHLKMNLLNEKEQASVEELLSEPASEETAKGVKQLKTTWERYNYLFEQLTKAHQAIKTNTRTEIEDDLMGMEVQIPILFFKQYYEQNQDKWKAVPTQTYITDKASLNGWFDRNPTHPITRDNVYNSTFSYNGSKTRYKWFEIKVGTFYSQELEENAAQIRVLMSALKGDLQPSISNYLPQTLWGKVIPKDAATPPDFKNTVAYDER